jgi:hypothetical protein
VWVSNSGGVEVVRPVEPASHVVKAHAKSSDEIEGYGSLVDVVERPRLDQLVLQGRRRNADRDGESRQG